MCWSLRGKQHKERDSWRIMWSTHERACVSRKILKQGLLVKDGNGFFQACTEMPPVLEMCWPIKQPPTPLHNMTSPWLFLMCGMDLTDIIDPKAWTDIDSFFWQLINVLRGGHISNLMKIELARFINSSIICQYGLSQSNIADNAKKSQQWYDGYLRPQFKVSPHNSKPFWQKNG